MKRVLLLVAAILCLSAIAQQESAGKRILAVLENSGIKSSHSIFFAYLQERGFTIDFVGSSDRNIKFQKYGEYLYDHLILFAPSASDIVGISSQDVLDFIDAGRNVIIAADTNIGDIAREIASDCNVEFDEEDTRVIDHFNFDTASGLDHGDHTVIALESVNDAPAVLKDLNAPVLFQGIGQDIEEDSELLFSLLSGSATSYSHHSVKAVKNLHVAGKKLSLVTAMQARNNARVVFSGSLQLFSDRFFTSNVQRTTDTKRFEKSGNEQFAKQVASWAFQEKGVLRIRNPHVHRVGESDVPRSFTINDTVEYSVEIEEWNGRRFVPYTGEDVQLEYIMLDPYVRTYLKHDGKGRFSSQFVLPDVYGVFTFKVEYHRKGLSFLDSILRVPVRPFRHNEYERFIPSAYPYYASAFSMMAGLFVFSWFFLYHRETK
eukprot:TRINITY_DN5466_c0_g1_i2.p1 TRINITY_DN5466_c0_g1~~TRINITY_DN5466_c0_g1_i2.p1  ORF type:complete len:432 (-),score=105.23 TRINITY_DN5466_c0_g1_i2:46-1341(-)